MCTVGNWRGFHSRNLGEELVIMEQCTECGEYRARVARDYPVVDPQAENTEQNTEPSDSSTNSEWDSHRTTPDGENSERDNHDETDDVIGW
jgi:hypothetical protein